MRHGLVQLVLIRSFFRNGYVPEICQVVGLQVMKIISQNYRLFRDNLTKLLILYLFFIELQI